MKVAQKIGGVICLLAAVHLIEIEAEHGWGWLLVVGALAVLG